MSRWYRIFGSSNCAPDPEALLQHLHPLHPEIAGQFRGDEQGWFRAELRSPAIHEPITLERFLAAEEGIRDELNAWAAWVEGAGNSPVHLYLMEYLIGVGQLITLHCPDDPNHPAALEPVCEVIVQTLAHQTAGVYQADGEGFFTSRGALLLSESS
jgi:hypothetical protein